MLRKILFIAFIASSTLSCSLSRDWVPSNVTEASKLAGGVIVGTVLNPPRNPMPFMIQEIFLENAVYYKGFGPSTVKISGYSQGSVCGIDAPKTGARVIVFVCKDEKSDGWKLHKYTSYAGQKIWNEQNQKDLESALGVPNSASSETFVYETCQERPPVVRKPFLAPVPVRVSPVSSNPPHIGAPPPSDTPNKQTSIGFPNLEDELNNVSITVNQTLKNTMGNRFFNGAGNNFKDLGNNLRSKFGNIPINFNSFFKGLDGSN